MEKNKQFEEWLCNNYTPLWRSYINDEIEIPPAQMWGVYLEFFDSVGICIDIQPLIEYDHEKYTKVLWFTIHIAHLGYLDNSITGGNEPEYKSRQEAQTEAVKKAFEILNSK